MRIIKIAALATAAFLSTPATTVSAESEAYFMIQVVVPDARSRAVSLTCAPDGGAHPRPAASCALLESVEGDMSRYPGEVGACTREYQPYRVSLRGQWAGRGISYWRTFANHCEMLRATGPVFDLRPV
ncbi:SSI family serine proteinase inhibitor [Nonomuraea sp. NPDC059194]|uniref:SSI family serine proteinase inhibitor n=1 Tax=Nonomuraea sp. NPDC059194 TaxID=3346764 RepID=UPI00368100FB